MPPRVLIVLGAGASYGSWDMATADPGSTWRPPLTASLFDFKQPGYLGKASPYPGAEALGRDLHLMAHSQGAGFDLESELRTYATASHPVTRKWSLQIPGYLSDLFRTVSNEYEMASGCYTNLVHQVAHTHQHELAFVVMNYDTLLERNLHAKYRWTFETIDDYARGNAGPVVKLHGSANWFRPLERTAGRWVDCLSVDLLGATSPIRIFGNEAGLGPNDAVCKFVHESKFWYPVLTAPLAGKDAKHRVCPEEHVRELARWCKDCDKLLVIGCSCRDANLVEVPSQSFRGRAIDVHVVAGGRLPGGMTGPTAVEQALAQAIAASDVLDRLRQGLAGQQVELRSSQVFDEGFGGYLSTRAVSGLLSKPA